MKSALFATNINIQRAVNQISKTLKNTSLHIQLKQSAVVPRGGKVVSFDEVETIDILPHVAKYCKINCKGLGSPCFFSFAYPKGRGDL